ncbi:MAG: 16S rRNA (adenine(1518)-N(6)/adenine(1519)-N(6))-dimethyltransferase RsmA [Dehalogenimonas sp.]|uniref:Ribosomal RNA small subunit methyltransferase A n=2 Tax=Candidatus Dehalogenimonas loeffleri TaxID=3127115 RepID=A0ABZ2J5T7_9CHLR|nr:16S rRNA (adenine(1518)-N(6)/adenine(1519)-N(6))-dimethyltransferase RsmA [Dehalogenimonas sp.]
MAETRSLLERYGLAARKSLGQNFLIDRGVLEKIVRAADVGPVETVIEVGPGLGVLTRALAAQAGKVIAVELDRGLAGLLRETLGDKTNVEIISGDILETPVADLVGQAPYKVVANLPYYITSPVLRHFLEGAHQPLSLTVMVQKEVARQITASPPEMSLLALGVQFFGRPKIVGYVAAGCFHPAPKVDSAILHISVKEQRELSPEQEKLFFTLARAGFGTRRKQLANALAGGLKLEKAEVLELLQLAGVDPARRAETLTIEEWLKLTKAQDERHV